MSSNYTSDNNFSKRVRAGKRAYFFDVKSTKSNDQYIVITESKKVADGDESVFLKNKVFLYKEDFDKFTEALHETILAARGIDFGPDGQASDGEEIR